MPGVNRKLKSRTTPKKPANKGKVGAVRTGGATAGAPGGRLPLVLKAGQRKPVNLDEFEVAARQRMSPLAYGYVAGGAGDERTVVANREAFAAIRLKPRVLVDVSHVDTRVSLLGQSLAHPILLAPTAYHKLSHPQGERACALGAAAAEAVMVVSSFASTAVEAIAEVAKASGASAGTTLWFQLYINPDRAFTRDLVARAEAAGLPRSVPHRGLAGVWDARPRSACALSAAREEWRQRKSEDAWRRRGRTGGPRQRRRQRLQPHG